MNNEEEQQEELLPLMPGEETTRVDIYCKSLANEYKVNVMEVRDDFSYFELTQSLTNVRKGQDRLRLEINSVGGSMNSFLILWSKLSGAFERKHITTHVPAIALSAGGFLFMMGQRRIMNESANIMFHTYSCTRSGTAEDIRRSLELMDKRIKKFFETYLAPRLPANVYQRMMDGEDIELTVQEACMYGICTHVETFEGQIVTAEHYLKCVS